MSAAGNCTPLSRRVNKNAALRESPGRHVATGSEARAVPERRLGLVAPDEIRMLPVQGVLIQREATDVLAEEVKRTGKTVRPQQPYHPLVAPRHAGRLFSSAPDWNRMRVMSPDMNAISAAIVLRHRKLATSRRLRR